MLIGFFVRGAWHASAKGTAPRDALGLLAVFGSETHLRPDRPVRQHLLGKPVAYVGTFSGKSRQVREGSPEREENGRNRRFSGLPSPGAGAARRRRQSAESLCQTWINEAARRIAPTGRDRAESVSLGYAHWRHRGSNPGPRPRPAILGSALLARRPRAPHSPPGIDERGKRTARPPITHERIYPP